SPAGTTRSTATTAPARPTTRPASCAEPSQAHGERGTDDMSVQPYTSPYAPPLNSNSSNSGSGPSIPSNSPVPDLQMVWQTAPDVVAAQASGSSGSSSSSASPSDFPTSTVDFGSIQNTLNLMLSASSDIV